MLPDKSRSMNTSTWRDKSNEMTQLNHSLPTIYYEIKHLCRFFHVFSEGIPNSFLIAVYTIYTTFIVESILPLPSD